MTALKTRLAPIALPVSTSGPVEDASGAAVRGGVMPLLGQQVPLAVARAVSIAAPLPAYPSRPILRLLDAPVQGDGAETGAPRTSARPVSLLILGALEDVGPLVQHAARNGGVRLLGVAVPPAVPARAQPHPGQRAASVRAFVGECGDPFTDAGPGVGLTTQTTEFLASVPLLGDLNDFEALLDHHAPDSVIICTGSEDLAARRDEIERALLRRRIAFRVVPSARHTISDLSRMRSAPLREPASQTQSSTPLFNLRLTPKGQPVESGRGRSSDQAVLVPRVIDFARLIGRTPYQADEASVARLLTGRRVLVTGAGGSIGSELVRVACRFAPREIVLVERSENALFEIDRQLASKFPKVARKAVLHDVVDSVGTLRLLEKHRPDVVFHSAAHKHVPLMEHHPGHAVTNNLFGTKSIADAALAVGCSHMVMISSDKAVNPTSVMGATKRLAELYIRHLASDQASRHSTSLSMVRFGNVLGSACSVLTIWGQQLSEGVPLTVTDPRMTRYFMTIPEAATLVIQSATLAPGAATARRGDRAGMFVLDMGNPIRILDLAARFAREHGLRPVIRTDAIPGAMRPEVEAWMRRESVSPIVEALPNGGLEIAFTGTRPGEKIHEELAYSQELLTATDHPGIRAWAGDRALGDIPLMLREMDSIRFDADPRDIVAALRRHVPEMTSGEVRADA